jgi:tRNA pseudouridine55 synthase
MKDNGLLIINKPVGYTSRDIVNIISKKLKTKKVGHTGTLDPLASGVLVITIGRYTKLGEMLTSLDKEYISEIKLGIKTDTLDITGNILEKKDFNLQKEDIEKVFKKFIGKYKMEVPIYSAIKINGKKLYEYARNNEAVELPIKTVEIKELELIDYQEGIIKFRTKVEKGTYIRSLIRDICKELNTIGTMNSLIRTKQGNFFIENAQELEDNYKLLKITDILNIQKYNLNDEEYQKVINGNSLVLKSNKEQLLLEYNNEEIAIYNKEDNIYICNVMLKINTQS